MFAAPQVHTSSQATAIAKPPWGGRVVFSCVWGLKRFHHTHSWMPEEALTANPKHREAIQALSGIRGLADQHSHIVDYLFRGRHIRAKNMDGVDVLFFGASHNDEKRFHFIEEVMGAAASRIRPARYEELEFTPRPVSRMGLMHHSGVVLAALGWLRAFHGPIDAALFQRTRVYLSSFFRCLYALGATERRPRAVIVGNDHSPAQTGCAAAARARSLPVIYVQHAPVPDYFPPLDFTLSVLLNDKTRDIYAAAGPVCGEVTTVSQFDDACATGRLMEDAEQLARVGVFLPAHPETEACELLVQRLIANDQVASVLMKPHPGAARALEPTASAKVAYADPTASNATLADDIDVAVFCNSGVALELLHEGVSCFYVPGLDAFAHDLYGFVRDGIVLERAPEQLDGAFWLRTDEERRRTLAMIARYDPTVEHDPDTLRMDLKRKLCGVLGLST